MSVIWEAKPDDAALCSICNPQMNSGPQTYATKGWNAFQEHLAAVHPDRAGSSTEGESK